MKKSNFEHAKQRLDAIFIDYLGLMNHVGEKNSNRAEKVSSSIRALKGFAKDLNIPVIVLSQLHRVDAQRVHKKPIMSDLKESGDIDAAADIIIFPWRPREIDRDTKEENILIIAKHRDGAKCDVPINFDEKIIKFTN